jgi:sphingomyelin phosphodiesterase acid-like 3
VSRMSRFIFLLVLAICPILGCGSGTATPTNSFQAVVFSDVHFNPFYDTTLFSQLVAADPSGWEAIFKTSKMTAPSVWGADTNYPLLALALSSIKQNLGTSPVIVYTGDLIGHRFSQQFFANNVSPVPPANPSPADIAAMEAFADKTVAFVTNEISTSTGNIPVAFALGNIDSYIGTGPDSVFLSNNVETFYTQFLNATVDHQTFVNTFTTGGYYSADLGPKLMVIGLNTTPLSPLIPANTAPSNNDAAVYTQLGWLDATFASAQAAGQKVWLLMHVPPGADAGTTLSTPSSFGGNGQLVTPAMMWVPAYQASFLQILSKYPGVISLILAAHTHMDEFRILSPTNVLEQAPAISPVFGNNPAFKVFTFTSDTFTPTDYRSLNYDLATLPAQFNNYYTFSTAYSLTGPLDASLATLGPDLVSDNAKQALYVGQFNSGNGSLNPANNTNWNLITPATWPVFWCGIGNMLPQDIVACVNSH